MSSRVCSPVGTASQTVAAADSAAFVATDRFDAEFDSLTNVEVGLALAAATRRERGT